MREEQKRETGNESQDLSLYTSWIQKPAKESHNPEYVIEGSFGTFDEWYNLYR